MDLSINCPGLSACPVDTSHAHIDGRVIPMTSEFAIPDEIRSVSTTGGEKGTKLARYDLLPVGPLRQVAEHYGKGASKYADHNWRRGYEWSKSYAALMRHATQFWSGEDLDEETGSHHMAAVAFHALALLEYAETHPDFDDRYVPASPEVEPLYFGTPPRRLCDPLDD